MGHWSRATPARRSGLCRANCEKVLAFPRRIQIVGWAVGASYPFGSTFVATDWLFDSPRERHYVLAVG
jgi:hypothetical protein